MIKIDNLTKRYPGSIEPALKSISLDIAKGSFFGLLGPNGCGKTTTISIICGLLAADSGSVEIDNKSIASHKDLIKSSLGIVPQNIALYPRLTLRENLEYFGSLYGLKGTHLQDRIKECISIARLSKFADHPVSSYSGGMKRRANLVVGIIHEPSILILDEPTVQVDPQSRNVIYKALEKLNQQGITMLYTTHYLDEAERLCDQIAIVDHGEMVVQGKPQELIAANEGCSDLGEVFIKLTGHELRD